MERKTYHKPELKTREIKLGVFGNYSNTGGDGLGSKTEPSPTEIIRDFDLHME